MTFGLWAQHASPAIYIVIYLLLGYVSYDFVVFFDHVPPSRCCIIALLKKMWIFPYDIVV